MSFQLLCVVISYPICGIKIKYIYVCRCVCGVDGNTIYVCSVDGRCAGVKRATENAKI